MYPQYQYNYQNPYMQQRQEIIKVNGEPGARAYNMPPNSQALLLDESEPIVWLKQTDGAGYPTITGYKITPYTMNNTDGLKALEARIAKLEERYESNTSTDSTKE